MKNNIVEVIDPYHREDFLLGLLRAASSIDNLDAYLRRILDVLGSQKGLGSRTGLAITLRDNKSSSPLILAKNLTRGERKLVLEAVCGSKLPKGFTAVAIRGGTAKGRLLVKVRGSAVRARASWICGIAAETINGRLYQDAGYMRVVRERDLAGSLAHIEELFLSSPSILLEGISRLMIDEARRLTGSGFGFAGYIDPATGSLRISALSGKAWSRSPRRGEDLISRELSGLSGWVLKHKKPFLTNSARSDQRTAKASAGHVKIERFAAAPALSGKNLIGILAVANPAQDYPPGSLDTMLELARLFALTLRQKLEELEKQAAEKKVEQLLQDIVHKNPFSIQLLDKEGRTLKVNATHTLIFGSVPPPDYSIFTDRQLKKHGFSPLLERVKKGETVRFPDIPYNPHDSDPAAPDRTTWLGAVVFPLCDAEGRPERFVVMHEDITVRKCLENILKEKEEQMRTIFETANDIFFIKDLSRRYVKANNACAAFFRLKPEDVPGKTDADIFPEEALGDIEAADRELFSTGKPVARTYERPTPSGTRWHNVVKTPLRGPSGKITGLLGVVRDITEIKSMQEELAIAKAREAVSREAKPIAHDFNNALAVINGCAALIDEDLPAANPIKGEIARIRGAVKRATALAAKLHDFTEKPLISIAPRRLKP